MVAFDCYDIQTFASQSRETSQGDEAIERNQFEDSNEMHAPKIMFYQCKLPRIHGFEFDKCQPFQSQCNQLFACKLPTSPKDHDQPNDMFLLQMVEARKTCEIQLGELWVECREDLILGVSYVCRGVERGGIGDYQDSGANPAPI
ncbi:hypothetical protein RRF57_012069 [Xylaria bambusicola]|uniref:Uncharacterized protein n=1 Tax=Xylaria bambusicola TaxID=326684 RepID=A0AAN7UUM4_9PEZI